MLELSAQDIKDIRKKYGLSQKSFAKLLGIGEASIARYETGAVPTRANKNLISAAADPSFMAECLKHDGDLLSESERQSVEKVVYALIDIDEGGEIDMNMCFEVTLQQEVLNEKAAQIMAELFKLRRNAKNEEDQFRVMVYEDLLEMIGDLFPTIVYPENASLIKLAEIKGQLSALENFIHEYSQYKVA